MDSGDERPQKRQKSNVVPPIKLRSYSRAVSPPGFRDKSVGSEKERSVVAESAEGSGGVASTTRPLVSDSSELRADPVPVPLSIGTSAALSSAAAVVPSTSGESASAAKSAPGSTPQPPSIPTKSPFRLTSIKGLPGECNIDAVSLPQLINNPDLKELWLFDYCFDMPWVMAQLDESKRDTIPVHVVHGSWRNDSAQKQHLTVAAERWANLSVRCAYMPTQNGTHHTKMMVLFTKKDGEVQAKIVIHTANMLDYDWQDMTQGLWLSPWLKKESSANKEKDSSSSWPIGSGQRFKLDLMRYLAHYQRKAHELVAQLGEYNFSSIRAAFVASAPSTVALSDAKPENYTSFGWLGLKQVLQAVTQSKRRARGGNQTEPKHDAVVMQVSSIATISEKWMDSLIDVLHTGQSHHASKRSCKQKTKLVYPCLQDIQHCLQGYGSGGSIHCKTLTAAHQKQVAWMRHMVHRWGPVSSADGTSNGGNSMRSLAAPHIKTYISYSDDYKRVDWALLTSANLSTQAWGGPLTKDEYKIASYEVGVVVWPELWDSNAVMVPTFGRDKFASDDAQAKSTAIPFRMPYDLPLSAYREQDEFWTPGQDHLEPDWRGVIWRLSRE